MTKKLAVVIPRLLREQNRKTGRRWTAQGNDVNILSRKKMFSRLTILEMKFGTLDKNIDIFATKKWRLSVSILLDGHGSSCSLVVPFAHAIMPETTTVILL